MSESHKDRLFAEQEKAISDFDFGEKTAAVFDDMLDRSIPEYRELQRMMGELAGEMAMSESNVYDLGCSTGITLKSLDETVKSDARLVGIDYSPAMLDKAQENLKDRHEAGRVAFRQADLNEGLQIENASVVILNLTLQFVRPMNREQLLESIVEGLNPGGVLILVEKVLGNDAFLNRLWIKLYYDMKRRNGYTETEIAQKREALENVLIPYRPEENMKILRRAGFDEVDMFFKWYNFAGFLALKA